MSKYQELLIIETWLTYCSSCSSIRLESPKSLGHSTNHVFRANVQYFQRFIISDKEIARISSFKVAYKGSDFEEKGTFSKKQKVWL